MTDSAALESADPTAFPHSSNNIAQADRVRHDFRFGLTRSLCPSNALDSIEIDPHSASMHVEMRRFVIDIKPGFVSLTALVLSVASLGACKPGNDADADKAVTPTAAAPTIVPGVAIDGAPGGFQSCEELGRLDALVGDSVTTICEIKLSGLDEGSSFKVELISGKVTEENMLGADSMVRVTKMTGSEVGQIMEEAAVTSLVAPTYRDIDGDGEGDILITRDVGNANSVDAVWLGNADGGPYLRVGEVAGAFGDPTAEGYMTVTARSGVATQCVSFYAMADEQLSLQARACVTAEDEAGTQTSCVLEEIDAFNALEVTEENRARFCAEPIVVNAFK